MKKVITFALSFLLILPAPTMFAAGTDLASYTKQILPLYDNVSEAELLEDIAGAAKTLGITEEEAAKQIYKELSEQDSLAKQEVQYGLFSDGKGNGTYTLASSSKGNIFYETASTIGIAHGHVGMYYSTATLVESVPGAGVRSLARTNKKVDPGAKVQEVKSAYATATQKSNAANWAYGRIGESYSYNFANNRNTSCIGDKNCSKLVWCAYLNTVGIDLDHNKGLGVYPKDIRDSSLLNTLISY